MYIFALVLRKTSLLISHFLKCFVLFIFSSKTFRPVGWALYLLWRSFSDQPLWVHGWFWIRGEFGVIVGRDCLTRLQGKRNGCVSWAILTHILEHQWAPQAQIILGGARFITCDVTFEENADGARSIFVLTRCIWAMALLTKNLVLWHTCPFDGMIDKFMSVGLWLNQLNSIRKGNTLPSEGGVHCYDTTLYMLIKLQFGRSVNDKRSLHCHHSDRER